MKNFAPSMGQAATTRYGSSPVDHPNRFMQASSATKGNQQSLPAKHLGEVLSACFATSNCRQQLSRQGSHHLLQNGTSSHYLRNISERFCPPLLPQQLVLARSNYHSRDSHCRPNSTAIFIVCTIHLQAQKQTGREESKLQVSRWKPCRACRSDGGVAQ